ncbi:hypothetical protein LCGC14_0475160 [marine sediment metagenome]|uniref:dATP/dGTP diphosphohydrolase N-terminal domain-containing protein n=1 Tax=marine sediment metagenome TaxID=412755 RepID=A0A0F9VJM0_9ZZZZ
MTIKKETGKERVFNTGAKKQAASGKGTPVFIPGDAILDIAKHFEDGAEHYGARNWEAGIPLSELLNSLERHLQQLKMGMTDESHDRAMVWNAIVYLATKLRIEAGILPAELNDMPKYGKLMIGQIDAENILKEEFDESPYTLEDGEAIDKVIEDSDARIQEACNRLYGKSKSESEEKLVRCNAVTFGCVKSRCPHEEPHKYTIACNESGLCKACKRSRCEGFCIEIEGQADLENVKYCRDCVHHTPRGKVCLEGIMLSGEDQEVGTCQLYEPNHKK